MSFENSQNEDAKSASEILFSSSSKKYVKKLIYTESFRLIFSGSQTTWFVCFVCQYLESAITAIIYLFA